MTRTVIAFVAFLAASAAVGLAQHPTAREMYTAALAREQTARIALAADSPDSGTLAEVRSVVNAYDALVRAFPASGYTDDALWQGGRLALDAFFKFNQTREKTTATRLLRLLASDYPASKFAKQVPEQLARIDQPAAPKGAPLHEEPARGAAVGDALQGVPSRLRTVTAIRRTVLADAVRITIELDGEVAFHDERIANPTRVFLDLGSTRAVPSLRDQTLRFNGDADIVRQVRVGRHTTDTIRVVLDAGGVASYSVFALYDPFRLVIDCVRGPEPAFAPPPLAARAIAAPPLTRLVPVSTPRGTSQIAAATEASPEPPPPPAADQPPAPGAPPSKNAGGGFSIARQLGLGVSRIVIDPGHGGHDPGAKGRGVDEAELVLDIALRVEKILEKSPGTEVILTRRTDEFVPLQERTAIANREGADLFLSIHANASANPTARGIETYFLNFASNMNAAAVAARENAASGQTMGALPDFVKAIALNNKIDESRDFATEVQRAIIDKVRGSNKTAKDLGVKQAPFVVLIGAAMPSVLAEISFVTNPQEAKLLKSNAYRQKIAEALVAAIHKYQTSLKATGPVARTSH